jgi:oxygen-dependent protoporphyrinogen oxidase
MAERIGMTPISTPSHRIAILGGGITGLAALHELRQNSHTSPGILIEASRQTGGVISTAHMAGFTIESGPDSFLTEKPEALELCRELGLGGELMGSNDADRRTYILHRGRLEPLPEGLFFFVPGEVLPIITSRLLPWSAKFQMLGEFFLRPAEHLKAGQQDESVAQFIRRHFGPSMLEAIVDPLLSGVYGGDAELLSMRSVLPRFLEMEAKYGSLIRATLRARKHAASTNRSQSIFTTLREGLGHLVCRLTACAEAANATSCFQICLESRVTQIELKSPESPEAGGSKRRYVIRLEGGRSHEAEVIIMALPAYEAGHLLAPLDAALGAALSAIPYSSTLTAALAFDETVARQLPPGFGFLVPKKEGRRMLASTFVHQKFNHRAPVGKALLRCFLGGARDPDTLEMEDSEILISVRQELEQILGIRAEPLFSLIHRWPRAMPQFNTGHSQRLAAIEEHIRKLPGVFLAGNAYSGIGIADCVRTGRAAARKAIQFLAPAGAL